MTYEEAYMGCSTLEELKRMAREDIIVAQMINLDRIPVIA